MVKGRSLGYNFKELVEKRPLSIQDFCAKWPIYIN